MPTFRNDVKQGTKVPLIKTDDLDDKSVTEKKLTDGSITKDKIAAGAVTSEKLQRNAVTTETINDGAVTSEKIAEGAVTMDGIEDSAVEESKINNKAVTNVKIGDAAVDTRTIEDKSVTNAKIADESVSAEKLQPGLRSTIVSTHDKAIELDKKKANVTDVDYALECLENKIGDRVVVEGNVTNLPDDEDLTSVQIGGREVVKLNDRAYEPSNFSGKGYKILRKNIQRLSLPTATILVSNIPSSSGSIAITINGKATTVALDVATDTTTAIIATKIGTALKDSLDDYDVSVSSNTIVLTRNNSKYASPSSIDVGNTTAGISVKDSITKSERKNVLTQNMINKPNTIYEIRYNFNLNDEIITIPENCILKFNGGNVYGGTINFNRCFLEGSISLQCKCLGQYLNTELNPRWFGAIGDGKSHKINEYYKSIEEAKKSYPFIDSLDCELDYCGIQSALNIMTNTADGKLLIPNGTYLIDKTLVCKSGRPHIEGVNAGNEEYKVHGTILKWVGDNGTEDEPNYVLKLYTTKNDNTYDSDVTFRYRNRPIVKSLMIAGKYSNTHTDNLAYYVSGIFIGSSSMFLIEDIRFTKLYDGIVFSSTLLCDLTRCWFYNIYRDCLSVRKNKVEGSTTLRISKTEFAIFCRYAINIQSQIPADNFIITECDFEGTSSIKVRPKKDFVQSIKSVVCLIGSSNTIIQNNRFESCLGHDYNLHLCSCGSIKILNNIFDIKDSLAAVALSVTTYTYTDDFTTYYNQYGIADFTSKRNVDIDNKRISNNDIVIINNDAINDKFKIHVLGKNSFANASQHKGIIISTTDITNCIECYEVKENTIDYSKTIPLGYGYPYIIGKDIFDIGAFSVYKNGKGTTNKLVIQLGTIPIRFYGSNKKVEMYDSLTFNTSVIDVPTTLLENRPLFYMDKDNSKRLESGVFTKTKIRYGGTRVPSEGTWEIGDIYYNRNVKYGDKCAGWICVEAGSPGKWMSFGNIFDGTLLTKGTTSQRPTPASTDSGFEYYDTTLKKKILWNGTEWTNVDGTALS